MEPRPNSRLCPEESQAPGSAKHLEKRYCRQKGTHESSRERQPRDTLPDVREARETKRARRLHQTCQSRGVSAEREAQSQVRKRAAAGAKVPSGSLTQKEDWSEHVKRSSVRKRRRDKQFFRGIKSHTLALEVCDQ